MTTTEIVERLTHQICACEKIGDSQTASQFREAKVEIERLRDDNEAMALTNGRRLDEIERLRDELATTELAFQQAVKDCHMGAAEIERLRATIAKMAQESDAEQGDGFLNDYD